MSLCWYFILAFASLTCLAQTRVSNSDEFEIPGGNIFGAALSREGTIFYAQQYLPAEEAGETNQHLVRISSWNTRDRVMVASRSFSEAQHNQTIPCRRTSLGIISGHLYVCSNRTSIRILDATALTTITIVPFHSDGTIRDFIVDESNDRLYLLEEHPDRASTLDEVTLSTGVRVNETVLPDAMYAYNPLFYRPASNLIALAVARTGGLGEKTEVVFYDGSTLRLVKRVSGLPRLDGFAFLGSTLLGVPGYGGYKKQECIFSIDLQTFKSDKLFCSPSTGIISSAAVVNTTYLVAFTGINKPKLFSDTIESEKSSVSVWSVETRKILKTLPLPVGFTSALSGATLLGSSGGRFVAYQSAGGSPVVISIQLGESTSASQ